MSLFCVKELQSLIRQFPHRPNCQYDSQAPTVAEMDNANELIKKSKVCFLLSIVFFFCIFVVMLVTLCVMGRCNYKTCNGFDVVKPVQMSLINAAEGVCCEYDDDRNCSKGREYPCTIMYTIEAILKHNQTYTFYHRQDKHAT